MQFTSGARDYLKSYTQKKKNAKQKLLLTILMFLSSHSRLVRDMTTIKFSRFFKPGEISSLDSRHNLRRKNKGNNPRNLVLLQYLKHCILLLNSYFRPMQSSSAVSIIRVHPFHSDIKKWTFCHLISKKREPRSFQTLFIICPCLYVWRLFCFPVFTFYYSPTLP